MVENSKSFSFASQYLDEERKKSVGALYAYCRYTDDLVDESWLPNETKREKLDELEYIIQNIETVTIPDNPILLALRDTVMKYDIPKPYLIELIEGVRMDLDTQEYETVEQLNLYCYRVASVVGILMCYIFGSTSQEALNRAADLGMAMQITNILRDIARDFEMGRIYLPRELREKYTISIEDLAFKNESQNLVNLMKEEIARARHYYKLGEKGLIYLPTGVDFTIEVASKVYAGILSRIEQMSYKVLTSRAVVPKWRKLLTVMRIKLRRNIINSPLSIMMRSVRPAHD